HARRKAAMTAWRVDVRRKSAVRFDVPSIAEPLAGPASTRGARPVPLCAMETTSFTLDGITLSALTGGDGGAPLLLVHGFTGCKEDFVDEVLPLADLGYHAVAPDLRGHGDSDHPAAE